ncbi:MAG: ABC transporter substrate-binding protein [Candidatus Dormibacteria bacterium]
MAKTPTVSRGGVYRAGTTSFGLTANLDPTGEDQPGFGFGIFAATIRTLVGFNGQQGPSGIKLLPELATTVPTPTDNGLTYTFHLKSDIKFGPPVNREITSQDFAYAFQRINDATLVPQYGYYYDGLIVGLSGTATNPDTPISGIDTPDATTIIFHLTRPQGDFLQLLAMPATAPIPPEVGKCFPQPATYGRDLISSGPYMFRGAASVNISSCATITPMAGFNPTSEITLVRNPNYVASTGDTPDYLNGVDITIDPNVADIFDKIRKGELDGSIFDNPPATVASTYLTSPSLRKYFHSTVAYWSESISMNLAVPPFTNVHVRKAVEWVLDRSAMTVAMGGKEFVSTATHINPPGFPGSLSASYNPYPTPNETGSLAKAKAQMRLSPYDPKHNGQCNVAICKNLIFINISQFAPIDPIVQTDLARIGIEISPRVLADTTAFLAIDNVHGLVPMSALGGGYSDYTGANSFAQPNFGSTAITGPSSCCNYSLVGLTRKQATAYGVPYPKGGIPSVDSIINRCQVESGPTQDACFEDLDKTMMTSVVAWAPYMWGHYMVVTASTVTRYVMSQSTGSISLDQIAVRNHVTLSS